MAEPSPVRADLGPADRQVYRGRAPVRPVRSPRLSDTADLPAVDPTPPPARQSASQRDLPRPLLVRRRWRRLRAGAAWSWTGLAFLVFFWGVWAVSVRDTELVGPVIGLGLVFAIGALLFLVSRLVGRAVLERWLGRERHSAWPSHLVVGGFWIMAGITFLQQTWWIRDAWQWLVGATGRLSAAGESLTGTGLL